MAVKSKRILVVDDLPDWRRTLQGLLHDEGYEVEVADSQLAALSLIKENEFDLAVLDIRLDESNENNTEGIDLALEIDKIRPATKIIIITGYGTVETVERTMREKGQDGKLATDFIPKDEIDSLIPIVNQVLS